MAQRRPVLDRRNVALDAAEVTPPLLAGHRRLLREYEIVAVNAHSVGWHVAESTPGAFPKLFSDRLREHLPVAIVALVGFLGLPGDHLPDDRR